MLHVCISGTALIQMSYLTVMPKSNLKYIKGIRENDNANKSIFEPIFDWSDLICVCVHVQVNDLNSMYEDIYDKSRDVDERDFLDRDGYLWIPFDETDSVGNFDGGVANSSVHDEPQYTTGASTTRTTPTESR